MFFGSECAGFADKESDSHRTEVSVSGPDAWTEVSEYELVEMVGVWDRVSGEDNDARAHRDKSEPLCPNQYVQVSGTGTGAVSRGVESFEIGTGRNKLLTPCPKNVCWKSSKTALAEKFRRTIRDDGARDDFADSKRVCWCPWPRRPVVRPHASVRRVGSRMSHGR